jgi:uncharacterized protein (DUF433 family)
VVERIGFAAHPSYNYCVKIENLVEVNPRKMSGTPVFTGTRVPLKNLFDYLEAGDGLDVFLGDFPTVTRDQALGVLELSKQTLLSQYEIAV